MATERLKADKNLRVLVWAPQLVTYVRLLLLLAATLSTNYSPWSAYALFFFSLSLDGLDGFLARTLGQVSELGAFLDVLVDIVSRAIIWSLAVDGAWKTVIILLECMTFTCTHAVGGMSWKENYFLKAPPWVTAVMRNGFKSPAGVLAVTGLMGLPMWFWAIKFLPDSILASRILGALLVIGRLLCASVEGWVVLRHLHTLLARDARERE